jgi:hypothetical protein
MAAVEECMAAACMAAVGCMAVMAAITDRFTSIFGW